MTFFHRMIAAVALSAGLVEGQTPEVFATGLQFAQRLIFTPGGSLLVTEGGTAEVNSGRLSIVNQAGTRRSLIEGLPSGPAHFTVPFGPNGMALDGRTLYMLIGEGDVMAGTPPNYGINLNGPSSPIFSSILKLRFSRDLDAIQSSFRMEGVHHWALLDGYDVDLSNGSGDRLTMTLLTAFRPLVNNVLGGTDRVRPSDPYGIVLDSTRQHLYVVDASAETISRVDVATGRAVTLYRFVPLLRTTPDGRVAVDHVPTSLCWWGDKLLVSNLSAGPLPPGEAAVRLFDPRTREMQPFRSGFTTITDIACDSAANRFIVAELIGTGTPPNGTVTLQAGDGRRVLASGVTPIGLAVHPRTGDIYVSANVPQLGGRILRIPAP